MAEDVLCYELLATGESCLGWAFKRFSTEVYESLEDAQADLPKFKAKCLDRERPEYALDNEFFKCRVRERKFVRANT